MNKEICKICNAKESFICEECPIRAIEIAKEEINVKKKTLPGASDEEDSEENL